MTTAKPTLLRASAASTLRLWINRGMESLWLLAAVLIPLAFLDRDFAASEAVISYVEVPKIALLRTLVGLMAVLWLIEWGIRGRLRFGTFFGGAGPSLRLKDRLHQLRAWLSERPTRWLFLAVWFFLGTTLLSSALSGSFNVSMWGEVPGQDGYPAYTIVAYVVLFAVIATHLKTKAQLWRLFGAITVMGSLIAGYGIFQHYGLDFLDLTESTGGGSRRVTSFMGNTLFAAAVMLMAIPLSLAAGTMSLRRPAGTNGSVGRRVRLWLAAVGVAGLWGVVLAVQLLGITFTFSRGPWIGMMVSLLGFLVLVTALVGWRTVGHAALVLCLAAALIVAVLQGLGSITILGMGRWLGVVFVLLGFLGVGAAFVNWRALNRAVVVAGVAAVLAAAVFLGAAWFKGDVGTGGDSSTPSNSGAESTSGQVAARLSSVKGEVLGGLGGRGTHWRVSWQLIKDRPWFEFDSLSLPWLRALIGYGPDLFRGTYLLRSPPEGISLFPLEPDHAHNYFIHQTVEQGVLGLLSSLGIFAAVFILGGYQLIRYRRSHSPVHKVVLIALLAVFAGRFLEMMVGVARVSDLMVLWVLLAVFAALPIAMSNPESEVEVAPSPQPRRIRQRGRSRSGNASRPRLYDWGLFWRLAIVAWLIGGIAVLTWVKSINYVRAAVEVGEGLEHYRQGDFQATLASLDQAIDLAPDVSLYYNHRANVYLTYQINPDLRPEQGCSAQKSLPYPVCLAARSFQSNLEAVQQRPFYYRSHLALANSAYNLPKLKEVTVQLYRESLALVPNSWPIRNELAEALLREGQPEEAIKLLEESLLITKDNYRSTQALYVQGMIYQDLGQLEKSAQALEKSLKLGLSGDQAANTVVTLGRIYVKLGDYQRGVERLDEALRQNPTDAKSLAHRSRAHLELAQYEQAIEDFEEATKLDPRVGFLSDLDKVIAVAYAERGRAYSERGKNGLAVLQLDEAIRRDSQVTMAYTIRAIAYSELGQDGQAARDLDAAIRLEPQDARSYIYRGLAYGKSGQYERAEEDFEQAIRVGLPNDDTYYHRGFAYATLGQFEKAIDDYTRAIELAPQRADFYKDRGRAYHQLGQFEEALRDLDRAIRLDTENVLAYNNRGKAYVALGQSPGGARGYVGEGGSTFFASFTEETWINGGTFRFVIPSSLLAFSGADVNLSFRSWESISHLPSVSDVFLGHAAGSGNPWDFDGNQVRVTWDGGNNEFEISRGGRFQSKTSDTVPFNLDSEKDLIIAFDTIGLRHGFKTSPGMPSIQGYTRINSQSAAEDAPVGLTPLPAGTLLGINDITLATSRVGGPLAGPSNSQELGNNTRLHSFYRRAIGDFDKAIRLDPAFANAYANRGDAFLKLGQSQRAAQDFDQAVQLNPKLPAGLPRP